MSNVNKIIQVGLYITYYHDHFDLRFGYYAVLTIPSGAYTDQFWCRNITIDN